MAADPDIGSVVGGYRIEEVAGRGGMGVVFRATQLSLDRTVALKLLAPEIADDEDFRHRFQRESRLLAAIDHPNVITVHEAGEQDGRLFIAMRYVVGIDMRALLRREGRLDARRATDLVAQVAAALDAAHARGLIHRDVKPANVLIEERDGRDHAYLSDFGLTKAVGSAASGPTGAGQFVGTIDFIAPEQVLGGAVDARADVYSLGCVLYMALAGRVPFERDAEVAKIFAHVNDPPPPLREYAPEVPALLEDVVARALEKNPDDRYPSAGDLARAAVAAAAGAEAAAPERTVATGEAAPTSAGATVPAATATGRGATTVVAEPPRGRRSRARVVVPLVVAAVAVAVVAIVVLGGGGGGGSKAAGGALSAKLVPQAIRLGAAPERVAVGDGAVWVADASDDTVTPVDAKSGQAGKPIPVGGIPGAIAVADGTVLMTVDSGRAMARLDAKRRTLIGSPVPGDYSADGDLAVGDGGVWAAMSTGDVSQVDPKTGRVVAAVTIPAPGADGGLAVGGGAAWVKATQSDRGFVFRVDTQSRKVVAKVDLGRGSSAGGLAFGEGALWIADVGRNLILRVDPKDNRVTRMATAKETGLSTDDIAVGGGAVWVATANPNRILRFDPKNGASSGPGVSVPTSEKSELVVGPGSAWLSEPTRHELTRLPY